MAQRKQDFNDDDEQIAHITEQAQLTIGIDPALLRRIEKVASEHQLSVDEYLGRILDLIVPTETSTIQKQTPPSASELLQRVLRIRERIIEESGGQLFEDSAETVRRMREERSQYLEQLNDYRPG
jgi:hypothetical protein